MITLLLLFSLVNAAPAAFEYRDNNPSSLFRYNLAASDDAALGHLGNPACLTLWSSTYISMSYSKPFLLKELNAGNLRAGYSTPRFALQAGWSSFGMDAYREDVFDGALGLRPFRFISLGCGYTHYMLRIKSDVCSMRMHLNDLKAAALLVPFPWLRLAFVQENMYSLLERRRRDLLFPGWSLGLALVPVKGVTLLYNLNRTYYGFVNSIALSVNLLSFLNFRAGYSRETSMYAASMGLVHGHVTVGYGIQYHPVLGSTHSVAVSLSLDRMGLSEIQYSGKVPKKERARERITRIDINACSLEELKGVPVLSAEMAERIMNYRRQMGPLSARALYQLGLSEREIDEAQEYLSGLIPDEQKADWRRDTPRRERAGYTVEKRKELFEKLLGSGIPSATALRIVEHARTKGKREILEEIDRMAGVPPETKRTMKAICAAAL